MVLVGDTRNIKTKKKTQYDNTENGRKKNYGNRNRLHLHKLNFNTKEALPPQSPVINNKKASLEKVKKTSSLY